MYAMICTKPYLSQVVSMVEGTCTIPAGAIGGQ